jgi:hypothetical protein
MQRTAALSVFDLMIARENGQKPRKYSVEEHVLQRQIPQKAMNALRATAATTAR